MSGIGASSIKNTPNVSIGDLKGKAQQSELINEEANLSLQDTKQRLNECQQKVRSLEAELSKMEQEVLFYASSKSWKITKPLREIKKLFKKKGS